MFQGAAIFFIIFVLRNVDGAGSACFNVQGTLKCVKNASLQANIEIQVYQPIKIDAPANLIGKAVTDKDGKFNASNLCGEDFKNPSRPPYIWFDHRCKGERDVGMIQLTSANTDLGTVILDNFTIDQPPKPNDRPLEPNENKKRINATRSQNTTQNDASRGTNTQNMTTPTQTATTPPQISIPLQGNTTSPSTGTTPSQNVTSQITKPATTPRSKSSTIPLAFANMGVVISSILLLLLF